MRPVVELSDDLVPVRRPHFELRNRRLFFLISSRAHAELDEGDASLWDCIDGSMTVGQLRSTIADVDERLRLLWDSGVCELVPSRVPVPGQRRRVLVIEPHMDDAVLSVGGTMWARREQCEFTVASVAGRSNFTSYYDLGRDYFDVDRVSALRQAESALAMRMLGGRHVALDQLEAPLRFHPGNWTLDWYRRHRKLVDGFIMHASTPQDVEALATPIERLLRDADAEEIWIPLGVGAHTDHELTRNACLSALRRVDGLERRRTVFFYQDVPYANQFPEHTHSIINALTAAGAGLEAQFEDIADSLSDKQRLASVFASQFKRSFMAPAIEAAARHASPKAGGCGELRFEMKRLPGPVDSLAVYSGREVVEGLVAPVAAWRERHRSDRRIRVLSPVPVARWVDDLTLLLETFPDAVLEVHVSRENVDETERLVTSRIDVRVVEGRNLAWMARLLRLAASRPLPTIVLTGEGLRPWSRAANGLFAFSDPLIATRMNDLAVALRAVSATR